MTTKESKVKRHRRRDGTIVKSFRRRVEAPNPSPKKPRLSRRKKITIGVAAVAGAGATGLALSKGIPKLKQIPQQRWDNAISKSAESIDQKANELLKEVTPYLNDEGAFKKLKRAAQMELIKKGKSANPFEPLENPDIVKKYNFVQSLKKAKEQEDFTFVLGGMDGGQGLTGTAIAGNLGIKLPSWGYRRGGLNNRNFLAKNSPNNTHYGHIWTQTQNTITFPRDTYNVPIPNTNIVAKIPGAPLGIPINNIHQQIDLLNAAFRKTNYLGVNPDGEELAAYAKAVNTLYPEKQINFVGQCGGGLHTIYAAEVLDKVGIKSKVFNIATPNFTPTRLGPDRLMTVISEFDENKIISNKNKDTKIFDVWGHGYFGNVPTSAKEKGKGIGTDTGYENSIEMQKLYKRFFSKRKSFNRKLKTLEFARTKGAKDLKPRRRKNSEGKTEVYHAGKWWVPNQPKPSDKKNKKRMVLASKKVDGETKYKVVHYGQKGYKHNYSPEAKKNYLTRSAGIRDKNGNLTKNDPWSPNRWARKDLWNPKLKADGRTTYSRGSLLGLIKFGIEKKNIG